MTSVPLCGRPGVARFLAANPSRSVKEAPFIKRPALLRFVDEMLQFEIIDYAFCRGRFNKKLFVGPVVVGQAGERFPFGDNGVYVAQSMVKFLPEFIILQG